MRTASIPTLRVKAADFTQEQVDGLIKALFKGQKIYETQTEGLTKGEISDSIVHFKAMKGSKEYRSDEDQEWITGRIAELEKRI